MVFVPANVADANKRVYSLPDTDVSTNETGVALPVEITYADFPEFFDETSEPLTTSTIYDFDDVSSGYTNHTLTIILDLDDTDIGLSGTVTRFRLWFDEYSTGTSWSWSKCYAQVSDGTDPYDFSTTPVEVTQGGTSGGSSGTDGSWSDWIDLELSSTDNLTIRFYTTAGNIAANSSPGTLSAIIGQGQATGDSASTVVWAGNTSAGTVFGVSGIELGGATFYKRISAEQDGSQLPIEVSPNEWQTGLSEYVSHLPLNLTTLPTTCANATTYYDGNYVPHLTLNPAEPLTGTYQGNQWLATASTYTDQKFNLDLGRAFIANRIYLENGHHQGTQTNTGIKNFILYGTNNATAFANTTYANTDDLTEIATLQAAEHVSSDVADPQYLEFSNNTAYRYYVLRIADCWGATSYMGIRHLEMQSNKSQAYAIDQSEGSNYEQADPSYPGGAFDDAVDGNIVNSWYAYYSGGYKTDGYVGKDYGEGNEKLITGLAIYNVPTGSYGARNFTFEGSNNATDWDVLLTVTDAYNTDFSSTYHSFSNTTYYRYYRVNVSQNWGDGTYLIIAELIFYENVSAEKAVLYIPVAANTATGAEITISADGTQDDNDDYVGLTAEADTSLFTANQATVTAGSGTWTYRCVIPASELSAFVGPIRIEFPYASTSWTISEAWIFKKATSGDAWDGESGTGVQITKDGSGSITVDTAGMLSDPINFEVSGTDGIVVTMEPSGGPYAYDTPPTNCIMYYKAVAEADLADAGASYASGGASYWGLVRSIVGVNPSKQIYDSNYAAVYHMAQDPSGGAGCIVDSTGNNNLTPEGAMATGDLVAGNIGKAIDFDGLNDAMETVSNMNYSDELTAEFFHYPRDNGTGHRLLDGDATTTPYFNDNSGLIYTGSATYAVDRDTAWTENAWHHDTYRASYANSYEGIRTNGADDFTITSAGSAQFTVNTKMNIGKHRSNINYYDGLIAEIRISNTMRSDTWLNLTAKAFLGTLWTVSAYDSAPTNPYQFDLTIVARSETLTDFPVTVPLGSASGLTDFDTTAVFGAYTLGQDELPSLEPIAHYTMDNVDGTTLVDERGTYDGTISNMTQTAGGKFDNYLAGGSVASVARNVDLGVSGIPFKTASMWVKRNVTLANEHFMVDPTGTYRVYCINSNDVLYMHGTNTGHIISDNTTWHHLVFREGSTSSYHTVWLDGVESSSEFASSFGNYIRYLGRNAASSGQYSANFDNIQIFDQVLTDAQIRDLYLADRQTFQTNMIHPDTVLLIESNDTDGATEFFDLSDSFHAITVAGDTHHETDQSKFSKSAIYFDGTGDLLTVSDHADFNLSSSNFTISFWVYFSNASTEVPLLVCSNGGWGSGNSDWAFYRTSGNIITFASWDTTHTGFVTLQSTTAVSSGVWYHIEAYVSDTNAGLAVNGTFEDTDTTSGTLDYSGFDIGIGDEPVSPGSAFANQFYGYMQGIQIIKGTALHTSDFVPPICLPSAPDYRKLIFKKGDTQLYSEVDVWETWDSTPANHKAVIQTKATLDTTETVLTCNFNPTNTDQSSYIGIVGSTPAQNVWNSAYVARYSMSQDPSVSDIFDSTSNDKHLAPTGTFDSGDLIDGPLGKAIALPTTSDYLDKSSDSNSLSAATLEAYYEADSFDEINGTPVLAIGNVDYDSFSISASSTYSIIGDSGPNSWNLIITGPTPTANIWTYRAATTETNLTILYDDGASYDSVATGPAVISNDAIKVGRHYSAASTYGLAGSVAEVRISNIARSAEWISATNDTLTDAIIVFTQSIVTPPPEEEFIGYVKPLAMFQGFINRYASNIMFPSQVQVNKYMLPKYTNFSGGGS